jgi:ubiquinone biosynthesis protein
VAGRDASGLAEALAAASPAGPAGGTGRRRPWPDLDAALTGVLQRHLPPGAVPDAAPFGAFLAVVRDAGVALDPVVYGALRSLATLQATLAALAPDLDLVAEAAAFGRHLTVPAAA